MSQALRVFVNAPAPPVVSGWLAGALAPAIQSCRFAGEPPPVELRSRMRPAGRIRPGDEDGRVVLAGRAALWSRHALASVYLHEVAHALCNRLSDHQEVEPHGPVFCLVMSCLYRRAAAVPHLSELPGSVGFYDFADRPGALSHVADWRAEVVRFLDAECCALASASCTAEELAPHACAAWQGFIAARIASGERMQADCARHERLVADLALRNSELNSDLATSKDATLGWSLMAMVGWFFAVVNGIACLKVLT